MELVGGADEVAGGKAALAQMPKEDVVRDETRHGDNRPAGAAIELLVQLIEIGNAGTRAVEHVEAPLERLDGAAVAQGLLAGEECVPQIGRAAGRDRGVKYGMTGEVRRAIKQ